MNDSFETIPKEYQEMCSFFIALSLQKKALGVKNFLKYFDPNSAYYARIKALTLFRLLQDPVKEIEGQLQEVSDLLYHSVQKDPESFPKALNILKEYVDRVFSLTRKTVDERVNFVMENSSQSWVFWYGHPEFSSWLVNFFKDEPIIYEPTDEEIRATEKQEIKIYLKQKEELIKDKEKKIFELEQKITELQRENQELHDYKQLSSPSITEEQEESLRERRQYYRIIVVGGQEKVNKRYKKLQKDEPNFLEELGLQWSQLGKLKWSYDLQKDKKFVKSIENALSLSPWKADFVVALQTDHETPFARLIENPEFWNRITVFAEREENDKNPKYSDQKFSKERFFYYLQRALEKYEREVDNTKGSCW
jgi:hypothetical protein